MQALAENNRSLIEVSWLGARALPGNNDPGMGKAKNPCADELSSAKGQRVTILSCLTLKVGTATVVLVVIVPGNNNI